MSETEEVWTVEGRWKARGHKSLKKDSVAYRHHFTEEAKVKALRRIGHVSLKNGTRLVLSFKEGREGKAVYGHHSLVNACLKAGSGDPDKRGSYE